MIVSNSCKCKKCKRTLSYEERICIKTLKYIPDTQCSGSLSKSMDNFSLCKDCYNKYQEHMFKFF